MRVLPYIGAVLLLILADWSGIRAQASGEEAYSIYRMDDLPQNDVNCIFRDSKGFMWIGTLDGLHRYDGHGYKTYRIGNEAVTISSNMVIDIDEDSRGNLWVATFSNGICMLDPVTDRITNFNSTVLKDKRVQFDDVNDLVVDSRDVIWIGNWFGVSRLTPNEDRDGFDDITTIPIEDMVGVSEGRAVKKIHEDREGQIWIGTNTHVVRLLNPYGGKSQFAFDLFEVKAHTIQEYEDGLLVGGDETYTLQKNRPGSYEIQMISELPSNDLLYKNQKIWAGNRNGITCLQYSPEEGWHEQFSINKENTPDQVMSNIVYTIVEDEIGQIWVGTRAGGINVINLEPRRFHHYGTGSGPGAVGSNYIQGIFEDYSGNLWIGTEDGGVSFLPVNNKDRYRDGFTSLEVNSDPNENRGYCFTETMTPGRGKGSSIMWIGTSYPDHLTAMDSRSREILPRAEIINELAFVFALENQGDSILWVGTYGSGLWRLTLDKGGQIIGHRQFEPVPGEDSGMASLIIRALLLDKEDNLWVATDKGLNRILASELGKEDPEIELFTKENAPGDLRHDYLLDIFQAVNGTVWIGSMGGGLVSASENSDGSLSFTTISEDDGLPSNAVKSIQQDARGNLWLATNHGLSRYNPTSGTIVNFDKEDGLQDNEFSEICSFRRSNGDMVFGGINGFNVFNPNLIVGDTLTPKMMLTDFFILNESIKPGQEADGKVVLEKSIEYTESITLKHKQNSFSIEFLGLSFRSPQKNSYRYMLEGFDQGWYHALAAYRIAKYTNVPAGDYTFRVIGSNSNNIWSREAATLNITIRRHPLLSIVAFFVYFILLGVIGLVVYNTLRVIALRKKELLLAEVEKHKVEEIAQIKLRFFTNISHEFRTPLTLITSPLETLIDKNDVMSPGERMDNYSLIRQNSNLLLRLVNQLMEFRRMDQGKSKMRVEKKDLVKFVNSIFKSFKPLAEQKHIRFEFIRPEHEVRIWFDRDKIEKVVYNLLSNAFKFTPKQGTITLRISDTEVFAKVRILVSDTGIGIDSKEHEHIFERFYQPEGKKKKNTTGTGIGLALTKGLVEMHRGEITVDSEKGKGSTFTVVLNQGKDWTEHLDQVEGIKEEIVPVQEEKADEGTPSTDTVEIEEYEGEALKILLAEDNVDLRGVIADLFRPKHTIFEADDGLQAHKLCMEQQPDIVISDIMMPHMTGIELCHKIKTEEAISHIPVLLLTAKNTEESQIEGFETGADAYMPKPFNSKLLRARIYSIIRNREKLRNKFQKEIEINPMIIANSPADSKFMDKILELIEENLSDSEFNVEKLAETYGVSRIYLNRKIKALTGETSNQFLRNIRLKHAAELLKQNVLTVSEITWHVGYNDLRSFRTRFKDKFGMSPSEYSKHILEDRERDISA